MTIYSISSNTLTTLLSQSVTSLQSQLASAELELSTGQDADVGLTLGYSAGQSISLQAQQSFLQATTTTNNTAATRLSTTQSTLADVQTTAQNFLNSMISNQSSETNASIIQKSASSGLSSLISDLNSSLGGSYLFAGTNTSNQPITNYFASGSANKQAIDSAFSSAFGMSQTDPNVSTISASDLSNFLDNQFADQFTGSNWTSNWSSASDTPLTSKISASRTDATSVSANQTAFQQLSEAYTMVAEFGSSNLSSDAYNTVMTKAQSLVSSAISQLTDLQSNVGVTQSAITTANSQMSAQMTILSTQVDNLDSADAYDAATKVNSLQTQIQVAYSLTNQLRQMSLVNYIS